MKGTHALALSLPNHLFHRSIQPPALESRAIGSSTCNPIPRSAVDSDNMVAPMARGCRSYRSSALSCIISRPIVMEMCQWFTYMAAFPQRVYRQFSHSACSCSTAADDAEWLNCRGKSFPVVSWLMSLFPDLVGGEECVAGCGGVRFVFSILFFAILFSFLRLPRPSG